MWADLALASSPIASPTRLTKSTLKLAPSPVPQGKQDARSPLKKRRPRVPLGPSEQRRLGIPASSTSPSVKMSCGIVVSYQSCEMGASRRAGLTLPPSSETFCLRVREAIVCSMSSRVKVWSVMLQAKRARRRKATQIRRQLASLAPKQRLGRFFTSIAALSLPRCWPSSSAHCRLHSAHSPMPVDSLKARSGFGRRPRRHRRPCSAFLSQSLQQQQWPPLDLSNLMYCDGEFLEQDG